MARLRAGRRIWLGGAVLALVAAVALVTLLVSGSGPAGPAPPAAPPPQALVGANTGRLFNGLPYDQRQIDEALNELRQSGATVARSDALWEVAEPVPPHQGIHDYDWSFDDEIAGSLARVGLRWLPIVDYAPAWARSDPRLNHSPPALPADYAAFAAALVTRYGPGGKFWSSHPGLSSQPVDTYEIWNEPDNVAFWQPAPAPAAYAALYRQARQAIRTVQPDARVIVGGLTHAASFLPALLQAAPDLSGQIDGVAIHPYAGDPQAVMQRVRGARAVLRSVSLSRVPLYVTEFGWTTSPPGALDYLPEPLRPGYVEQTLADLGQSGCGVAAAILYAWVTPERDPADPQDWFGVEPPRGGASPDVAALARGFTALEGPVAFSPTC